MAHLFLQVVDIGYREITRLNLELKIMIFDKKKLTSTKIWQSKMLVQVLLQVEPEIPCDELIVQLESYCYLYN